MPGWMKNKMESIPGRNITNFRYAYNTSLMAESEAELETLDESEKGE